MWSLSGARRSWHPHRSHQLLFQLVIAAPQCHNQSNFFSTATTIPPEIRAPQKRREMDKGPAKYGRWTKDDLIKRILKLESKLEQHNHHPHHHHHHHSQAEVVKEAPTTETSTATEDGPQRKKKKKNGDNNGRIDPSKYSTRLVALKLAYIGKNYGGFEYQVSAKVPTIEEELWKAMVKACLIFPENPHEVNWDSQEYSKCGRTDRGVSAFGQVIAVRMRSQRPLPKEPEPANDVVGEAEIPDATETKTAAETETEKGTEKKPPKRDFDDVIDELPYSRILNRLLPPDIRVLAWCPTTPAEFSARHHCRERQYRYFFTQPAFSPTPQSLEDPKVTAQRRERQQPREGWLDIPAMRAAAKKFEGLHDFRNFCKVDGSKHQQSFERRIFESDIVEVVDASTALPYLSNSEFLSDSSSSSSSSSSAVTREDQTFPKVYYFHVRGSAFLWHQIRCMVAVLFFVGQGLEDPSIIDKLLDVESEPRRPAYALANETPLVLWDCVFPRDLDAVAEGSAPRVDGMDWVYVGEDHALNAHGPTGLVDEAWAQWRERKMDELLAAQFLGIVATQADLSRRLDPRAPLFAPATSRRVFEGGDRGRGAGTYVPLLKMTRVTAPADVYDKDARKRGYESAAHMREVLEQQRAAEAEVAVDDDY
ncbi:pseudouridine synthase [Xylaria sp. CBS 124048]|nr:pseudouridine synthase [Xylaria sp. CBS 124048]